MKIRCDLGIHSWSHCYDFGLFKAKQEQRGLFFPDMRMVCGRCGIDRPGKKLARHLPEVVPSS